MVAGCVAAQPCPEVQVFRKSNLTREGFAFRETVGKQSLCVQREYVKIQKLSGYQAYQ